MQFSRRTGWDTTEGSLTRAIREAGPGLIDLTLSNPTLCGFTYGPEVLGTLAQENALHYQPDPRGIPSARQAVAAYYNGAVDADQIILTTSTSEAYSFLFRLLCNPGDTVLVASPTYPLFDFLSDLEDIRLDRYPLFHDYGWWIDFAELERKITDRTRAILLVHPNNPTGHITTPPERARLQSLCASHGIALIVDEVFLDYGLISKVESFTAGDHPCLTFIVSGLSKIAALPQMKVGWLAALGPGRDEALARLEIIADTFLSMSTPAQLALPSWLLGRAAMQQQILERVRANLQQLQNLTGLALLPVEAGWSAILRGRNALDAEQLVRSSRVITHPGHFYGLDSKSLVISLLGDVLSMRQGVDNLNQWMNL